MESAQELDGAANYAAALLARIETEQASGALNPSEAEYCLAAAREIFELEMLFFDSQFELPDGPGSSSQTTAS